MILILQLLQLITNNISIIELLESNFIYNNSWTRVAFQI